MLNAIQLGKDAKLILDCTLSTYDIVLTNYDGIEFNSYREGNYSNINLDTLPSDLLHIIENAITKYGEIVHPYENSSFIFVAKEDGIVYVNEDWNLTFKMVFHRGDVIRFLRNYDEIQIKRMDFPEY